MRRAKSSATLVALCITAGVVGRGVVVVVVLGLLVVGGDCFGFFDPDDFPVAGLFDFGLDALAFGFFVVVVTG